MSLDGNNWVFFTERWDHQLQEVVITPSAATNLLVAVRVIEHQLIILDVCAE